MGMTPFAPSSSAHPRSGPESRTASSTSLRGKSSLSHLNPASASQHAEATTNGRPPAQPVQGRRRRYNDTRDLDVIAQEIQAENRAMRSRAASGAATPMRFGTMSSDSLVAPDALRSYGMGGSMPSSPYAMSPLSQSQTSLRNGFASTPSLHTLPARPGANDSTLSLSLFQAFHGSVNPSESASRRLNVPQGMDIGYGDNPYPHMMRSRTDVDMMPPLASDASSMRSQSMLFSPDGRSPTGDPSTAGTPLTSSPTSPALVMSMTDPNAQRDPRVPSTRRSFLRGLRKGGDSSKPRMNLARSLPTRETWESPGVSPTSSAPTAPGAAGTPAAPKAGAQAKGTPPSQPLNPPHSAAPSRASVVSATSGTHSLHTAASHASMAPAPMPPASTSSTMPNSPQGPAPQTHSASTRLGSSPLSTSQPPTPTTATAPAPASSNPASSKPEGTPSGPTATPASSAPPAPAGRSPPAPAAPRRGSAATATAPTPVRPAKNPARSEASIPGRWKRGIASFFRPKKKSNTPAPTPPQRPPPRAAAVRDAPANASAGKPMKPSKRATRTAPSTVLPTSQSAPTVAPRTAPPPVPHPAPPAVSRRASQPDSQPDPSTSGGSVPVASPPAQSPVASPPTQSPVASPPTQSPVASRPPSPPKAWSSASSAPVLPSPALGSLQLMGSPTLSQHASNSPEVLQTNAFTNLRLVDPPAASTAALHTSVERDATTEQNASPLPPAALMASLQPSPDITEDQAGVPNMSAPVSSQSSPLKPAPALPTTAAPSWQSPAVSPQVDDLPSWAQSVLLEFSEPQATPPRPGAASSQAPYLPPAVSPETFSSGTPIHIASPSMAYQPTLSREGQLGSPFSPGTVSVEGQALGLGDDLQSTPSRMGRADRVRVLGSTAE
ncbi:hypothetical protein MBRA1_002127 [Malassezia brasiliensis]|uniref:Uncharacterized protein n=1 Tax=Malassezia brasiliensis TaxID=1821822 RepID=A0AAF0DTR3_9BASI|nr:hypothetical protein MBRA1_002127 [Malassezia brasiliensis]